MSFAFKGISLIFVSVFLQICAIPIAAGQQAQRCSFDTTSLRFHGSETEQARCLLRPVKPFGHIGKRLRHYPLPSPNCSGSKWLSVRKP